MKIDPHDIQIRLNQARRFLMDGHKVQIVQNFRGREMVHRDRGHKRMREIVEKLSDIAKLETPARLNGRRLSMIMAPDKPKIAQIKRQNATEAAAAAEPETPENESSDTPLVAPPAPEAPAPADTPVEPAPSQ